MTRLSPILDSTDLPLAELCAARLDGEVVGIADSFIPIDVPETPAHRALAVGRHWPARLIAEQRTAAWIWGVTDEPPAAPEICASSGARGRASGNGRSAVREVAIDADEVTVVAGVTITAIARTIADLARNANGFSSDDISLVQRLATRGGLDASACSQQLERRRNLPHKLLAASRIRSALGEEVQRGGKDQPADQPELTR